MRRARIKSTVAALTVLAGFLWAGKIVYDHNLQERVLARHTQQLKTAKSLMHDSLLHVVQDAHQLAAISCVQGYSDAPSEVTRNRLERTLIDTSNVYGRYDQIRYIDLDGMEKVRVNQDENGAYAVAQSRLQNKANSYYIEQGKTLKPGQVYLSPMDLNVENDEVERPYKPTIRLVRKVANNNGEAAGLLVLNYSAGQLLNRFREHFPDMDRAMLLNEDGYWLLNSRRKNEWGWQLVQPEATLQAWRPRLWERTQAQPSGTMTQDGDLFSYAHFDMSNFSRQGQQSDYLVKRGLKNEINAGRWTLLVQTSKAHWQSQALYVRHWFQAFIAGVFVLVATLVYFITASRQQRRNARKAQRRQLENFKDLYDNAPIGYITLSASGLITNVNRALLGYLGYQRNELVNQHHFFDLVDDQSRAGINGLMDALDTGDQQQYRVQLCCKNGERLDVQCCISSRLSTSSTLTVGRCSVMDISRQVSLERKLERLAYCDSLTGLANRRYFDQLAHREIKRLQREGGTLTALALDIDYFKSVNDTYGHDAGDEVLKSLAASCQPLLRASDIMARLGGEEFTVLLPGASLTEGRDKAEALRQTLADTAVVSADGDSIHYTVSIGVAVLERPDEAQLPALLKQADRALYQAKESGRNQVCVTAQ